MNHNNRTVDLSHQREPSRMINEFELRRSINRIFSFHLLFYRRIKMDLIAQEFLVGVSFVEMIPFINRMIEHLVKHHVMNAK